MMNPETLAREKLLFAYSQALERGDFSRLEEILRLASLDPLLESQILELHAALTQSPAQASLLDRVRLSFQRFKFTPIAIFSAWSWLRPAIAVLAVLTVLVITGLALLGPAIGNIFSESIAALPEGTQTPQRLHLQSTALASASQPVFPAGTPTPYVEQYSNAFSAYPSPGEIQTQTGQRKIARNGYLSLVVKDTRLARQAVSDMLAQYAAEGAFIVTSNENYLAGNPMPVINMTLRIPVKHYDEAMNRLAGLSIQVLNRQESAEDISQSYVDVSARIEALQISRDRLLQIVKEAKTQDDLLRAEQELSRRESELDAAKASQQYLAQTAALSSITLDLRPPAISQPVSDATWNPAVTLRAAVRVLLANLRSLADSLIYFAVVTLPWILLLAILIFAAVRIFRPRSQPHK